MENELKLQYIDPHSYGHQRCVFLVLQGCSTGGPGAQLSAGWWLSLPHLVSNSSDLQLQTQSGVPRVPSAGWWLSLPHLVSNSSESNSLTSFSTELYNSSIAHSISIFMASQAGICHVRRLWTVMFDHHQAEITVVQFRGHSPPVRQSISVPWDFTLSHFSAKPAYAISSHNCHRNVPLPSGASLLNGMFGLVEGQYTTDGATITIFLSLLTPLRS